MVYDVQVIAFRLSVAVHREAEEESRQAAIYLDSTIVCMPFVLRCMNGLVER